MQAKLARKLQEEDLSSLDNNAKFNYQTVLTEETRSQATV